MNKKTLKCAHLISDVQFIIVIAHEPCTLVRLGSLSKGPIYFLPPMDEDSLSETPVPTVTAVLPCT
jgi:hypothetical protein